MKTYTVRMIERFLVTASDNNSADMVGALLQQGLATTDMHIVKRNAEREVIVVSEEKNASFYDGDSNKVIENANKFARFLKRISELQCHIEANERTIEELEREIAVKDEIIRKQAVMMTKKGE